MDQTLQLFSDPYRFIARECEKRHSDVFRTRLFLSEAVCMRGARQAELFYDTTRFRRQGAAPEPVRATLFGKGTVQSLDGEPHRLRKQLFLQTLNPRSVDRLVQMTRRTVLEHAAAWLQEGRIGFYECMRVALTEAVCRWAGIPLEETDIRKRARQLSALFDLAASKGTGHLRSRLSRHRAENWIMECLPLLRGPGASADEALPAAAIAEYRDLDGEHLPARIAAAEILNLLRPVVAVSVYTVFVVHALELNPVCAERIKTGEESHINAFVEEVRRYYPFFPAVMARAREDFSWRGFHFTKNTRVLLDLYGTNHHPELWTSPEKFDPDRFDGARPGEYDLIPQGGGDYAANHRCPGEPLTVELMKTLLHVLLFQLSYSVPPQNLELRMGRAPAIPASGMVIRCNRLTQ